MFKLTELSKPCFVFFLLVTSFTAVAEQKLRFESIGDTITPHHFVDNKQCIECHSEQSKEWQNSHHAQAMQNANTLTVQGNFNDIKFTHHGVTSTFFRENKDFYVNTEGADGELSNFKIKYTFGIDPLQQYIIEFDNGKLQTLDIAWDTRDKNQGGQKWFRLIPEENAQPGEAPHWTGLSYNWNNRCAECHSTNVQKNYDLSSNSYNTSWSEINVSCQSCHGPGSGHIDNLSLADVDKSKNTLLVDYASMSQREQTDTCARCHSRRHQVSPIDGHGKNFLDDFLPATLDENLYYPDGQILDEVFVYGSFLQSKMYVNGVGCMDCHNPHSGQLKLTGNALCMQCHQVSPPKQRFPSLQIKIYDSPEHHFHKAGSEGAQCINCHMPATTYMEVDPRRDHSFKIPSPALSLKIGTPNACNRCHQDKSIEWAKDAMEEWYGKTLLTGHSYGEILYATRNGDPEALDRVVNVINSDETPSIWTATLIKELVKYFPDPVAIEPSVAALKHSDPLVRASAVSNIDWIPARYQLPLVLPLLDDPAKAVRVDAARIAAKIPTESLGDNKIAFNKALGEYQALQNSLADTAEAHLNLGVLYSDQRKFKLAENEFKLAIDINEHFLPAYINLANLYNTIGENKEAEMTFRKALEIAPENGEIYYSLGLLLGEQNRYTEAVIELAKATKLLPDRQRIVYNYALSLQHLEQHAAAAAVLKQLHAKSPNNREYVHTLIIVYAQQQQWASALEYAEQLVALSPGEQEPARLLQQLQYQVNNTVR